jgi:hypothetical protein
MNIQIKHALKCHKFTLSEYDINYTRSAEMKVSGIGKQVPEVQPGTPNLEFLQTTEDEAVDQVPPSGTVQTLNVSMCFLRFLPLVLLH